jgi:hypothetical protein
MNPRPVARLEQTLARAGKEQGLAQGVSADRFLFWRSDHRAGQFADSRPPICAEYDAMQRCCYRPLHFKGKGLRRSQGYCVLLESVRGRRSLHPNDEDLSVGTLVLAVAPISGL